MAARQGLAAAAAMAAAASRWRAATAGRLPDPYDDGGRWHHTPPAVDQLLLAQPLVVGGCVAPPAHQVARDSPHPAAVEQQLRLVLGTARPPVPYNNERCQAQAR